ncbi:MAG: alginate export family protein [Gammaproteobacteria bacterium]|nr:alginate export family protein [Gammaproteobacteria bacterium]
MRLREVGRGSVCAAAAIACLGAMPAAADPIDELIAGGEVSLELRMRLELVDEDSARRDATGSTLRTRLSYRTGAVHGLRGFIEFDDLRAFTEDYDSGVNARTQYAVIADPEGTELNQAYLDFSGWRDTTLRLGRQRIVLDNARFVGNVGWRQNEQTFDAISVTSAPIDDTVLSYAYIGNINTISGANIETRTHLFNGRYEGFAAGTLLGYAYLLDTARSTDDSQTIGARFNGRHPFAGENLALLFTAEAAWQREHADAPATVDADYYLLDAGIAAAQTTLRIGRERLDGDGTYAFQTPLATKHAFNGWADRFLVTPLAGLVDDWIVVEATRWGTKLALAYHDFSASHGDADYGREFDLMATRKFGGRYLAGAKYARYDADSFSVDTDKFWLWVEATL